MATFRSVNTAINFNNINLNWYIQNYFDEFFENNTYSSVNGTRYEDTYVINGYDGVYDLYFAYGGSNFAVSNNNVTGTVKIIAEVESTYSQGWFLSGISVSASLIFAAAITSSTADDFLLLARAMKGNDTLYLSNSSDLAYGFLGNDIIYGYGGTDYIIGGAGSDTLIGGNGHDYYYFDANLGASNVDKITASSQDFFVLDNDIFTKFSMYDSFDNISSSNYVVGRKALDSNDYLIYNPLNDTIYYDADGSGKGIMIAFCKTSDTPRYDDFLIIG